MFVSAPTFLFVQLLRFANSSRKIVSKVVPENVLVLPNGDKYKIASIGNHLGSLTTSGHYQALIKSGSTWIKTDDDRNQKTHIRNEINGDNYIFLYKKFSTTSMFVPSESWEEVLEDQPIPPGLHVKLDMETGKKYARLVNEVISTGEEKHNNEQTNNEIESRIKSTRSGTINNKPKDVQTKIMTEDKNVEKRIQDSDISLAKE